MSTSCTVHAVTLAMWFAFGTPTIGVEPPEPTVEYLELPAYEEQVPEVEEPAPEPKAPEYLPPEVEVPADPEQVAGFQELAPPEETSGIPPESADADSVRAEDFSGRGMAGGVAGGTAPPGEIAKSAAELAPPAPVRPATVELADVTEAPQLVNRDALGALLQRHYPAFLRQTRTAGAVRVQFVVDSTGRLQDGSVMILESTHPLFDGATREALRSFRFTPGRMAWRGAMVAVPVRVTTTLEWNVR